jgi:NAD(P)-dependent dehydrogenase (short-subunit alcohol dehydrogenase family)
VSGYLEGLFSLGGKVALVTGASRGIGAALAGALAAAGAATTGIARSPRGESTGAEYRQCDVRDRAASERLCAELFDRHARLDILVNAAGITLPSMGQGVDAFEETIATNLVAAYHCCEAVAPFMKRGGGGSIVNLTSIGSVLGFPGNPGYVAAKGGLRMMTRSLALDLAPHGIRVNNIAPGYVRTAMTEASFNDPALNAERVSRMMIPRWGRPEDLAGAVIYLASDASAYVTGTDLFVDGGWAARGL